MQYRCVNALKFALILRLLLVNSLKVIDKVLIMLMKQCSGAAGDQYAGDRGGAAE